MWNCSFKPNTKTPIHNNEHKIVQRIGRNTESTIEQFKTLGFGKECNTRTQTHQHISSQLRMDDLL